MRQLQAQIDGQNFASVLSSGSTFLSSGFQAFSMSQKLLITVTIIGGVAVICFLKDRDFKKNITCSDMSSKLLLSVGSVKFIKTLLSAFKS